MSANTAVIFIAGLLALVVGAELVVRGATRLAALLGIDPLVLGLTVVAVGTSVPELAVGIYASLQGSGSLAVGNIAGTNTFNILFILGLSAFLRPLPLQMQVLKLDLPMMVAAAAMMMGLAWDGRLTPLDGGIMLVVAALYTLAVVRLSRRESTSVRMEYEDMCGADVEDTCTTDEAERRRRARRSMEKYALMLALGMVITVLGAEWMVSGAVGIARALSISEATIGLTIVAVGTSSPELATTFVATLRRERDVAVGNLLGSSIYNILVILGLTCLVSPGGLQVERQLLIFDIPLMASVALACVPVFLTGRCVSRWEGGLGVAVYLAYLLWILLLRA